MNNFGARKDDPSSKISNQIPSKKWGFKIKHTEVGFVLSLNISICKGNSPSVKSSSCQKENSILMHMKSWQATCGGDSRVVRTMPRSHLNLSYGINHSPTPFPILPVPHNASSVQFILYPPNIMAFPLLYMPSKLPGRRVAIFRGSSLNRFSPDLRYLNWHKARKQCNLKA